MTPWVEGCVLSVGDLAHGVVKGQAKDLDEEVNGVAGQVALGCYLALNPLGTGRAFDLAVRLAMCNTIGRIDGIGREINYNVRVVNRGPRKGDPISAGRNCHGPNVRVLGQTLGAKYSIPDFIFGTAPLTPPGGRAGMQRTAFDAEVKRRAKTMYDEYISPGRMRKQLDAILAYSGTHTYTHVAVFIIGKNDMKRSFNDRVRYYVLRRVIGAKALPQGVIPGIVAIF